jgi:translation elongation factor EF-G
MFGYIGDLRTMTSGRGQFSMEIYRFVRLLYKFIGETVSLRHKNS